MQPVIAFLRVCRDFAAATHNDVLMPNFVADFDLDAAVAQLAEIYDNAKAVSPQRSHKLAHGTNEGLTTLSECIFAQHGDELRKYLAPYRDIDESCITRWLLPIETDRWFVSQLLKRERTERRLFKRQ